MKVLIADDDPVSRDILKHNFAGHNCEVIEAENGDEGFRFAKEYSPDVIISDAMMPLVDGFQFLKKIKEEKNLKKIPFIFYSAIFTGSDDYELAMSLGAEAFIAKPKKSEEFWNELQEILDKFRLAKKSAPAKAAEKTNGEFHEKHTNVFTKKIMEKVKELEDEVIEHKKTAESLRLFRSLLNQSNDAIYIIDPDTSSFLDMNERACLKLGYKYEELLNFRAIDFLLDEESWKSRLEELKSKQKLLIESMSKHKDGTLMPTEISMRFITHSGKDYVLAVARDITERKQAEEEKKRFEKQLEHSQRMGAVGQLAEGIAHDFNNILTAIVGYSSLLQMKIKDDNELKHSVEQIIASTERAADLTKSLLTFSRKQPISPEPVDLNNIIKNFKDFIKRALGKDIVLNTDLHEDSLTVMADTRQIEQVLINLATNAKDAMPRGGRLEIQTGAATIGSDFVGDYGCGAEGLYSLITVKDTGMGMDEKTKLKIFEPFFTTKGIDKNTGLGLSIVYGIISQHNGYINVESEKNKGAEFKIYLPLIKSKELSAKPVQLAMPMSGTETVLVADDEDMIREVISKSLSEFGYNVITAVDGEDAINKFIENKEKIKVVILDLQMPKKPGKKVFEEISKINPDVKAIFMDGYSYDIEHKEKTHKKGSSHIFKPFMPTEIIGKIREVLDK